MTGRQQVEAPIRALGGALARKHARRVLLLAPVRVDARRVGEVAGQVLAQQEREQVAPVAILRHRELRHARVAQRLGVIVAADLAAPHDVAVLVVGRRARHRGPAAQEIERLGPDRVERVVVSVAKSRTRRVDSVGEGGVGETVERRRQRRIAERAQRLVETVGAAGRLRSMLQVRGGTSSVRGNLGEVARALGRNERVTLDQHRRTGICDCPATATFAGPRVELRAERGEQPVDAGIVEAAGDRREDGHLGVRHPERRVVAAPLLAHVAQRILGTALLELVERDQLGEVEHVDLLELARRAVLAGHDVQRHVDEVDDLGVTLADARCLDHDQVEGCVLEQVEHVGEDRARGEVLPAGGERAHEDLLGGERIHADAVAEQRPAAAAARRVHRDHRHVALGEMPHETHQQLVRQARLAGTARAGDTDDRRPALGAHDGLAQRLAQPVGLLAALERRDRAGDLLVVPRAHGPEAERRARPRPDAREHVLDHAVEAELAAVLRGVDALHAVGLQFLDLVRRDRAAAAYDHPDVAGAEVAQHVDHVAEVLVVAALVGADGDAVGVLLHGGAHDVRDAAVVAEVHDLRAVGLQQAANDVDRRVVPVEERRRAHEAERRFVRTSLGQPLRGAGRLA